MTEPRIHIKELDVDKGENFFCCNMKEFEKKVGIATAGFVDMIVSKTITYILLFCVIGNRIIV